MITTSTHSFASAEFHCANNSDEFHFNNSSVEVADLAFEGTAHFAFDLTFLAALVLADKPDLVALVLADKPELPEKHLLAYRYWHHDV